MTFTFTPSPLNRIRADRSTFGGQPAVYLSLVDHDGRDAAVFIPVDRLEEVIAGLREVARQAGGQPTVTPEEAAVQGAWNALGDAVRRRLDNAEEAGA
ncbi:hypothetical protein [Streptomyces sp. W1SF4]|uniref:hypothetical protein n=1 Tax=Streptomyces sp. W1SF4 TaxID=2305220 RepID=UPI000F6FB535|nr:hypothetical protein [Streptomyces sp. W1SF4]AZM91456.1 hypothetical protein D1J60_25720 [Streptomyces sp. W1SF4]